MQNVWENVIHGNKEYVCLAGVLNIINKENVRNCKLCNKKMKIA